MFADRICKLKIATIVAILCVGITACTDAIPVTTVAFYNIESFAKLKDKFGRTGRVSFSADNLSIVELDTVKNGKLFVGDKSFAPGTLSSGTYSWGLFEPCSGLPQGDNITIRYELYDSAGAIVKQNSISGVKISAC